MFAGECRKVAAEFPDVTFDEAMDAVIAEAKALTPDLGGRAGTAQMGDAVAAAL